MTTFVDGPAKGQVLALKHAPKLLRVTTYGGKWDALDQPHDYPTPMETIYAYRLLTHHGVAHVNRGSKGSGFFTIATYSVVLPPVNEATMRDNASWLEWCKNELCER